MDGAPYRPCAYPGCPGISRERYCETHAGERVDRRGSSAARGYGGAWKRLRLRVLQRDRYTCQAVDCGRTVDASAHVDHIVPKSQGGTDDPTNLQTLCPGCHSKKTQRGQ